MQQPTLPTTPRFRLDDAFSVEDVLERSRTFMQRARDQPTTPHPAPRLLPLQEINATSDYCSAAPATCADLRATLSTALFLLPKVELHAHFNGSISRALLLYLAEQVGTPCLAAWKERTGTMSFTTLDCTATGGLHAASPTADGSPSSHAEWMHACFDVFRCIYEIIDNVAFLRLAAQDILLHYLVENVQYLEIRTSLRDGVVWKEPPPPATAMRRTECITGLEYVTIILDTMGDLLAGDLLLYYDESTHTVREVRAHACEDASDTDPSIACAAQWLAARYPAPLESLACEECLTDPKAVVTRGILQRRWRMDLRCALLLSVNRGLGLDKAEETIQVAREVLRKRAVSQNVRSSVCLVGLDLAGNCYRGEVGDFIPLLARAREELGLPLTVHAAEKDDEKELDALIALGPARFGHLTFASERCIKAIHAMQGTAASGVLSPLCNVPCVEICISSNACTSHLQSIEEHHIHHWWGALGKAAGIAICTDDRGVFHTSLTRELLLLCQHRGLFPRLWCTNEQAHRPQGPDEGSEVGGSTHSKGIRDAIGTCLSLQRIALAHAFVPPIVEKKA